MEKPILYKRLSELKTSEQGVITKVFGHGSFRNRITEMGFVRGKAVKVIKNAPLLDPIEYEIMGYRIALRKSEAELIEVTVAENAFGPSSRHGDATFRDESVNRFLHEAGKTINVALVGNPNCGKTSLFNTASGSHERVGNYSGVTVDAKEAHFRQDGYTIRLFDLPGTYSITEYTPEELYVRAHLLNEMPDVVVNVVDASNLERNLLLTTQLIDMNLKVVIALNMYDELERSGDTLNYRDLGRMIGIPIIPTVANRKEGIDALFKTVIDVFEDNEPVVRHIHINYGADIEQSIRTLQAKIWENKDLVARYSSRYLAIRLLGNDKNIREIVASRAANSDEIDATAARLREKLEHRYGEPAETIITDAKYGFIAGALEETYRSRNAGKKHVPADRIDRVMTHRIWGLPIFLLLMWITFQATFSLGGIPAEWMEAGVQWLGDWVTGLMPEGSLRELLVGGIISGVGGVIVFLPNILILFFFISLMEDTGYMARAAFIMDKLMHKIGLHGKSFIPLLMGFGCNVPAIMATRTLESRKDRVMTMLIIPFMSCSARLPVYVLLISAFFPHNQGLVLFSIYLIGILIAVLSSVLFKKLLFAKQEASVRHGASAVPHPDRTQRRKAYVGQRRAVPEKDGNRDPARLDHHLGAGTLPAKRRILDRLRGRESSGRRLGPKRRGETGADTAPRQQPIRRTSGKIVHRPDRALHRAGYPTARFRLADRSQSGQRTGSQGSHRQYDGRTEQQRRRRNHARAESAKANLRIGPKSGRACLHTTGRLHADDFHPALLPLHRRHGGDPQRGRRTLGAVHPVLHNGLSMVIVSARLSDRKPFLTGATTCRKS